MLGKFGTSLLKLTGGCCARGGSNGALVSPVGSLVAFPEVVEKNREDATPQLCRSAETNLAGNFPRVRMSDIATLIFPFRHFPALLLLSIWHSTVFPKSILTLVRGTWWPQINFGDVSEISGW